MKLREIIKDIPDNDWLEITEQSSNSNTYKSYIGRAPKKYILGKVLEYEALYTGGNENPKNYHIHQFLVKDNCIEVTD